MSVIALPQRLEITSEQARILDRYTSKSLLNEIQRELEYIKLHPQQMVYLAKQALNGGMAGCLSSVGIAWTAQVVARKIFGVNLFSDSATAMAQAAFAGGVAGGVLGASYRVVKINQSTHFIEWKMEAIRTHVYPLFMEFLENDNELRGHLCVITNELIRNPVRDLHGHVYEQEAIITWIHAKEGVAKCPHRGEGVIVEGELEPDRVYHRAVIQRMREVLALDIDPNLRKGMEAYIQNVKYERDQFAAAEITQVTEMLKTGEISLEQYNERCEQIYKRYSIEPQN